MKNLVRAIEEVGGKLFLFNDGLKLTAPIGTITHDMQARIKRHKVEIINFITQSTGLVENDPKQLQKNVKPESLYLPFQVEVETKSLPTDEFRSEFKTDNSQKGNETPAPNCWNCHYYDGRGAAWPGKCRYFELLGQEAREIDFNSIDPNKGCRFFIKTARNMISTKKIKELGKLSVTAQTTIAVSSIHRTSVKLPSPVALAWLLENRCALDKAGWTRPELYRRNKSERGIAWLDLWDNPFFMVYLHNSGVIEFECSVNGRDFFQTVSPQKRRSIEQKTLPLCT